MTANSVKALFRLKRRVLCGWLNFHVGHPEVRGGTMYHYCTRCNSLNHPVDLTEYRRQVIEGQR